MSTQTLTATLRLDAAANVLAGIALVPAAGWLAPSLGLDAAWPIRVLAVLLLANGVSNAVVAARPDPPQLTALTVVDVGFGVGVLALVATDPTGAAASARGLLAAVAVASLGMGLAKWLGRRRIAPAGARSAHVDPQPAGR